MEMFYTNDTLYVNIDDRVDFSLIKRLRNKIYHIIDMYHISNIEIKILNDNHFDLTLIDDLINDYKVRYNGRIIVK